jgi:uncharacterized SAM-binding protein YcdF (DUF218 family)
MYAVTKGLEFFLEPGNVLVVLLGVGFALYRSRAKDAGFYISAASAGCLVILFLFPIGYELMLPLENQYARPPWPRHVDGVLVLGGALDSLVFLSRGAPSESDVEGRLVSAAELLRHYPNARLIFSGGSGVPGNPPEAQAARLAFDQLGVDQKRVIYESRSRTTWENLLYSQMLTRPGETWVLTTSASQMPRAMAVARRLNWRLVPWPSDYRTVVGGGLQFVDLKPDLAGNLETLDLALHEWIGLYVYWLTDKARLA